MLTKHKTHRAQIFQSFDALKGFREILKEKEKIIVPKRELSNDDLEILDRTIHLIKPGMIIKIIYYDENEYVQFTGRVVKLDLDNKKIQIVKKKLDLKDIVDIEIDSGIC